MGFDEWSSGAATRITAATDFSTTDRVTLEIRSAKLNVAIQHALRRRRSHDNKPPLQGTTAEAGDENGVGAAGEQQRDQASCASGRGSGQDPGSVKEAALLKAAVESLRAGLREKEDIVTELEREREVLVDKATQLDSTTKDNLRLAQKIADLDGQVDRLQTKLTQADAGRDLTMTLVDTLKSAQNDLKRAHGQLAQRCADLENMAEDASEAVRRGDILLHSQQLKIDAQSRQLQRQDEDLTNLRSERELQLTKADQCAAELAQVLRRERAGQGRITDAQAEVNELRGEMEHMREAFARHRKVMRKNQEVIDAHEKALRDVRSELLSLSLEAEKQSARHQQAATDAALEMSRALGEKDAALREARVLRIEKEDLKDQRVESDRKEAAAEAAGGNTKQHTSSKLNRVTAMTPSTPTRRPPSQEHPQMDRSFNTAQQQRQQGTNNGAPTPTVTPYRDSNIPEREGFLAATRPRLMVSSSSVGSPRPSSPLQTAGSHDVRALSSHNNTTSPFTRRTDTGNTRDPPSSPSPTADAGGGDGDGGGGGARGGANDRSLAGGDKTTNEEDDDNGSNKSEPSTENGKRKALYVHRSRPRLPPQDENESFSRVVASGGKERDTAVVAGSSLTVDGVRKNKARKLAEGDAAGRVISGIPSRDTMGEEKSPRRATNLLASDNDASNRAAPNTSLDACPCCGDSPYGLMINCFSCSLQHHSSCVTDGQRVGKGLGAVFHCSKCTTSRDT